MDFLICGDLEHTIVDLATLDHLVDALVLLAHLALQIRNNTPIQGSVRELGACRRQYLCFIYLFATL
jgi:hypothetical protein